MTHTINIIDRYRLGNKETGFKFPSVVYNDQLESNVFKLQLGILPRIPNGR